MTPSGRVALASIVVALATALGFAIVDPGHVPARSSHAARSEHAGMAVGINLAEVAYYGAEYPFVDAFKSSRPFWHQSADDWELEEPLELRDDGYPARLGAGRWAGTLMFRGIGTSYPAGNYVCLYDGSGYIQFDFAATVLSSDPGRIVVGVQPSDEGIYLKITETDPADPVRNIHLLMPGHEETYEQEPFHPAFLARWRGFTALRFMDWQRTNDSEAVTWSQRTLPGHQTQAGPGGVALEHALDLANTLAADPWLCVPHRADDAWVAELAELCAEHLDRDRTVYLEYSNETWNGMFEQADYCRDRGRQQELSADDNVARLRYYAQRSAEVFTQFEHVLGDERTVCVVGVQNANPHAGREVLEWAETWKRAEALAVAPYFGGALGDPSRRREVAAMSVTDVLAACRADVEHTLASAAIHARTAHSYGFPLLAYEAGPHLAGYGGAENHQASTELFIAANRDEEMGAIYRTYLQGWQKLGGGLLMAFHSTSTPSKWGSWGLCEHYGPESENAPKYRAVRALATSKE